MKFGLICSAGGTSFFSAFDILLKAGKINKDDFYIITDRECLAEKNSYYRGISYKRIPFTNTKTFSKKVLDIFKKESIDIGILLFNRIVSPDLFNIFPLLNIHPSILPAFKGFNSISRQLKAKVPFVGSTVHIVNKKIDGGPIIGQIVLPVVRNINKKMALKISYLQKTYLILMIIDILLLRLMLIKKKKGEFIFKLRSNTKFSTSANPMIQSLDLLRLFSKFMKLNKLDKYSKLIFTQKLAKL